MWYDNAEDYVIWATLALAACAWVLSLQKPALRSVPLIVVALGAGIYIGIERTAKGSEVWGIPLDNVLRPEDKDSSIDQSTE
jgi:hypothetical protein